MTSRSSCPHCNRTLSWLELLPILSYFLGRRRCKSCCFRISWQYPAIECIAAIIVVLLFRRNGISAEYAWNSTFILLMLLVAIVDWQHLLIPNRIILSGFIIGILLVLLISPNRILQHLLSSLIAALTMFAVSILAKNMFGKPAMGMGDVKLGLILGLFLGYPSFLISLWFAAVLGSIYGLSLRISNQSHSAPGWGSVLALHMKSEDRTQDLAGEIVLVNSGDVKLPFGSFLAFSSSVVLLWGDFFSNAAQSWLFPSP